jgi:hypothetical protein
VNVAGITSLGTVKIASGIVTAVSGVVTYYGDGQYLVNGEIQVKNADGKIIPTKDRSCALCRCGQSDNKPFCDGSHVKAGFKA